MTKPDPVDVSQEIYSSLIRRCDELDSGMPQCLWVDGVATGALEGYVAITVMQLVKQDIVAPADVERIVTRSIACVLSDSIRVHLERIVAAKAARSH